jgi:hypothetical protein
MVSEDTWHVDEWTIWMMKFWLVMKTDMTFGFIRQCQAICTCLVTTVRFPRLSHRCEKCWGPSSAKYRAQCQAALTLNHTIREVWKGEILEDSLWLEHHHCRPGMSREHHHLGEPRRSHPTPPLSFGVPLGASRTAISHPTWTECTLNGRDLWGYSDCPRTAKVSALLQSGESAIIRFVSWVGEIQILCEYDEILWIFSQYT